MLGKKISICKFILNMKYKTAILVCPVWKIEDKYEKKKNYVWYKKSKKVKKLKH